MVQRWWDRPAAPYVALLASPALTLPLSAIILGNIPECGADEPWWELRHFELALLPALASFLPFLWLLSSSPEVRRAATFAGLIGSVRYFITQAVVLVASLASAGQAADPNCTISTFFVAGILFPVMLALWLISALIAAVILFRAPPNKR